jgi:hypothetical protein
MELWLPQSQSQWLQWKYSWHISLTPIQMVLYCFLLLILIFTWFIQFLLSLEMSSWNKFCVALTNHTSEWGSLMLTLKFIKRVMSLFVSWLRRAYNLFLFQLWFFALSFCELEWIRTLAYFFFEWTRVNFHFKLFFKCKLSISLF